MNKSFDYLNLEINPENYSLNKRLTLDKHKVNCCFKETFNHTLHSHSNSEIPEQLNSLVDLFCNFSRHSKTNLDKIYNSVENSGNNKVENNLNYIKTLIEEIHNKPKISTEIKILIEKQNKLEEQLQSIIKTLDKILYG